MITCMLSNCLTTVVRNSQKPDNLCFWWQVGGVCFPGSVLGLLTLKSIPPPHPPYFPWLCSIWQGVSLLEEALEETGVQEEGNSLVASQLSLHHYNQSPLFSSLCLKCQSSLLSWLDLGKASAGWILISCCCQSSSLLGLCRIVQGQLYNLEQHGLCQIPRSAYSWDPLNPV